MRVIDARNVHAALPEGIKLLRSAGIPKLTRGGECLVYPGPVTTVYRKPCERVLFWPERDANPYFFFFEGLWMLAGRDDVAFLAQFVKRIATFSDDGETLHGAYGHRWRYPVDQLNTLVLLLQKHPNTRRAVLTMWRAADDLFDEEAEHKDVPCNTQIYFWRAQGADEERLHMTVTCRSNDIIWGAYGANAVHFSMLQEYMAARLGIAVGYYWQVSNNFHAYTSVLKDIELTKGQKDYPYECLVKPYALMSAPDYFDSDLFNFFMDSESAVYDNTMFHEVALPILRSHQSYKRGHIGLAFEYLRYCQAEDWRLACEEWLQRRQK